jgi:membrane protease YdiL (CAAX protease family)
MAGSDLPVLPSPRGLLVHLQGHILLFDRKPAPDYDASAGTRLLFAAVVLEVVRLGLVRWLYPMVPLLILVPVFLISALLSIRFLAGLNLSAIGFQPWRKWTAKEKSYFVQLLVIANIVFPLVLAPRLKAVLGHPNALSIVANVFVPYLFYGFYQEVVYRGMIQSELVRRWGPFAGILVANLLYTFGPLHWNYFSPIKVVMFAAIFAIGLFFGILFRRSGNLWIVAVIHGIGNAYLVGSLAPTR